MTIPVFREPETHDLEVKVDGYKLLKFTAKIPTLTHVNAKFRLQLATRLGIGENLILTDSFETILGMSLLDAYLVTYPPEILKIFESLPEGERQNWEFFPDSKITDAVVSAFIDKLVEIENGKKKSKPLDAIRELGQPARLVSNPTLENLSEELEELRRRAASPSPSTSTDRGTGQPTESITPNATREPKKVRHRSE